MPDPIFADPRLARLYDPLEGDRPDLDLYVDMVEEFGARSVLDIGCGTGTLACRLAAGGIEVVGLDPAEASLAIARAKPGGALVRWIHGDATTLPPLRVDLATMTGNVAQVFLRDDELGAVLRDIAGALHPGGAIVFESRDPEREAWRRWTRSHSAQRTHLADGDVITSWVDLLDVSLPFVSFRWTFCFERSGEQIVSDSTLRFRSRAELARAVSDAGLTVLDVRDAPDRPGHELVFVCHRGRATGGR